MENVNSIHLKLGKHFSDPLPLSEYSEKYRDLIPVKVLRKSKFCVCLAYSRREEKYYAMKNFPYQDQDLHPCFLNTLPFLNFSHPNLIKVLHANPKKECPLQDRSSLSSYVVMELASNGDLADLILQNKFPKDDMLIRTYFHQLIEAIDYLHSRGYAHTDIKPENILIGEEYRLKLADFDNCFKLDDDLSKLHSGSRNYRAPEIIAKECRDPRMADIYSAGIVLFVMKFHCFPYQEDKMTKGCDLTKLLNSGSPLFWKAFEKCSGASCMNLCDEFKSLLQSMVMFNPDLRATIKDIKKNKWYQGPTLSQKEVASIMISMDHISNLISKGSKSSK